MRGLVKIVKKGLPTENTYSQELTLRVGLSNGVTLIMPEFSSRYFKYFNAVDGPAAGDELDVEIMQFEAQTYGSFETKRVINSEEKVSTKYNGGVTASQFVIHGWSQCEEDAGVFGNVDVSNQRAAKQAGTPSGTALDKSAGTSVSAGEEAFLKASATK